MVVYNSDIEKRLKKCDKKLRTLFQDYMKAHQLMSQTIQAIEQYYNTSYRKATRTKTIEQITSSYELLVDNLSQIKNTKLSPDMALKQISRDINSRKRNVLYHDVAKAAESIFWAATATTLYAAVFGIALPILIVQPVLGVAVGITIVGAMLAAAYKSFACLTEFKSYSRHSLEYEHETSLVSFFSKTSKRIQHMECDEISLSQEEDVSDRSPCFNF
ncbi:DUF5638 domain-containing protein [Legionella longbeachae]|uniref:DUF5638 domain-containing protein n=1 Tax=Legionella longbeachae serogroup 1 (strain NSW150) TaxID=661367 RepID=D3HT63_LEGLN|nr:DUF5638 domain-containing protein [Legionella longbeachae]VEE02597.1 Uncharacterised protein [Legionella oakridgensis]HBD7397859.1 hypothetical protein [Legionella pneumophila]ARB91137.1 hypothetical protein A6J40_02570 [Legionella longbeachae]ARM32435.1 hypothetical protein B0B39_02340 [Legionella longbeachae]EEZ94755.1 hypothetical protein LLB_3672 [Legionella longbeachae D-4968]